MKTFDERQLLQLKKQVEEAKTRDSELRGLRLALFKQMKDNFNCDTINQAKEMLQQVFKDMEQMSKTIEQKIEALHSQYNLL